MPNIYSPDLKPSEAGRVARLAEAAGADRLGMSLYELEPGDAMVFHYHLQREELLIVMRGEIALRTAEGVRELEEGTVVSFHAGPRGAHGFENRTASAVRVLVVSEQNGPNVSVYPDANEIGVFDAPHPAERRFGARFRLDDALGGYGGGEPVV
jgi:uncharacterized cupin superfamily protein